MREAEVEERSKHSLAFQQQQQQPPSAERHEEATSDSSRGSFELLERASTVDAPSISKEIKVASCLLQSHIIGHVCVHLIYLDNLYT